MKTLFKTALLFLALLFACAVLYRPLVWGNPYLGLMSKGVAASTPAGCDGYIICQNFEGTGYDNSETWGTYESGTGYVHDPDFTSLALRGSQSLRLYGGGDSGEYAGAYSLFASSQPELYVAFRFYANPLSETTQELINLSTGGDGSPGTRIVLPGTGIAYVDSGLTASSGGSCSISPDTTYYVWLDAIKGTGSNAVARMYVGTTRTKPETPCASLTNGSLSTNMDSVTFLANHNGDLLIDQVMIKTSAFTTLEE